jgi:hypothetical protein
MICPVPKCGKDHFRQDGILKLIHASEAWSLVDQYQKLMLEIFASMQNDAVGNRSGAFLTRLRDAEECYFKGLWVGLMASPEEIVHDSSGESPWWTLATFEKWVSKTVFDNESRLSAKLSAPGNPDFKAMDTLNASTHLTAKFLLQLSHFPDDDAKVMYGKALINIQTEVSHLGYVSNALKAGKDRNMLIRAVRTLRNGVPPSPA